MRLLLDTHVLVWFTEASPKLSKRCLDLIEDESNDVLVSAATAWEIATKHRLGKLPSCGYLAQAFEVEVERRQFQALPISAAHGRLAGAFMSDHKDPFDRILAAQAILEGVPLLSRDEALDSFPAQRIW